MAQLNGVRVFFSFCVAVVAVKLSQGVLIGTLPTEQHQVTGQFHVLDSKTILIENFVYDGLGPGAFLYYYRPGDPVRSSGGGFNIPLPPPFGQPAGDRYPGAFQRRRFNNEDIRVTLPEGVDACDIGTITVWCQPFQAIFTRLAIPRNIFVNDGSDPCTLVDVSGPPDVGPEFDNCVVLHDTLQLSWRVRQNDSQVRFQLCGCTASDPSTIQYLGFGLSGSPAATSMFRADATIAWVNASGVAQAEDYFLSGYVQCRGGRGACQDTVDTSTGSTCTNDVTDVAGFLQDGQQCIAFTRPFNPTDSGSCDIPIDPTNQNQYIVWGIGSLGVSAFQHHTRASGTDSPIHLGRSPAMNQCTGVQLSCQQCAAFPPPKLEVREDTTFKVEIGPSANPRGYTGITGRPGWGIAWFINGTIIPELVIERGRTYTFLVYGGANPIDGSNYHPFYITNSPSGGRLLNTPEQRAGESVFAGFDSQDNETTVGVLCEYAETTTSETIRQTCGSYSDYLASLVLSCQSGEPGRLVWTPDDSTPDIVYYQCASHLNLGHVIRVMDPSSKSTTASTYTTTSITTSTTPTDSVAISTATTTTSTTPTDSVATSTATTTTSTTPTDSVAISTATMTTSTTPTDSVAISIATMTTSTTPTDSVVIFTDMSEGPTGEGSDTAIAAGIIIAIALPVVVGVILLAVGVVIVIVVVVVVLQSGRKSQLAGAPYRLENQATPPISESPDDEKQPLEDTSTKI